MSRAVETRRFLALLHDRDLGALLSASEQSAFAQWLVETVEAEPELLIAFTLADGTRGYAHYRVRLGPIDTMTALSLPTIFLPKGDGCAYLPLDLASVPCWLLGHGEIVPTRF